MCLVLSCILCLFFVGGCNNQEDMITVEDIVQSLKSNSFNDTYTYTEEVSEDSTIFTETRIAINKEDTCYIKLGKQDNMKCILFIMNISDKTDIKKLLITITPLFGLQLSDKEINDMLEIYDDMPNSKLLDDKVLYYYLPANSKYDKYDDKYGKIYLMIEQE